MTTTEQIMPTLAEIEAGLRARLAELTTMSESEADKRDKMRRLITRTAHTQGDSNSIGESLDDLLIELGLEPRPIPVNTTFRVVHRQTLTEAHRIRDISPTPWASYQNLHTTIIETASDMGIVVKVPREQTTGCGCQITPTDEQIDGVLGRMADGVTRVSVTPLRCGMAEYPWSSSRNEVSRCVSVAAAHVRTREEARDDPLVQQCTTYGHPGTRHWHVQFTNGDIEYTVTAESAPDVYPQAVLLRGCYARSTAVVGEPVVEVPEPVVEDEVERVQQCDFTMHPSRAYHRHVEFPGADTLSYSRDLTYTVQADETILPGVFSHDAERVGKAVAELDDGF